MYYNDNNIAYSELTNNNEKIKLFSNDYHFELSYKLGREIFGPKFEDELSDYALLIIKPEALITGKVAQIVKLLEQYEFMPVLFYVNKLCFIQTAEIWKYIWPAASTIRIVVNEKFFSTFDSFILILKNSNKNQKFATSYLCSLKGSADPKKRNANSFRSILQPITPLLNHLHTADEPIDFIRETGILLDLEELSNMYYKMKQNATISYNDILERSKPYFNEQNSINTTYILDTYIKNMQDLRKNNLLNPAESQAIDKIIYILKAVHRGAKCLDMDFLYQLKVAGQLKWTWELFILLTQFIEFKTTLPPLLD